MAFEAQVARGIALLDEKEPGWRDKVNLDRLDMGSCARCILGQVFGDYDDGFWALDLEKGTPYGFDSWARDYADLTTAWIRALTKEPVR